MLQRFIPTCVGNTGCPPQRTGAASVHPHVRGEYLSSMSWVLTLFGSSPRAWGIQPSTEGGPGTARFIPTCVGNTEERPASTEDGKGSSPRAWGIPRPWCRKRPSGRFIPTCVGNTEERPASTEDGKGSSPRAWGIPGRGRAVTRWIRFIPTCVGNTAYRSGAGQDSAVHPHVRGEYDVVYAFTQSRHGSSPRAWGIQDMGTVRWPRSRFIPTCVGNTGPAGR